MKPTLILLAAGMGSRYGGLKQLEGVGPSGEIIMDYTIFDALEAGFGKIVFVIRKNMEDDFRESMLDKMNATNISTELVFQKIEDLPKGIAPPEKREKPWGTAHALWACRDTVETPFAIANADDFYGRSSLAMMAQHLSKMPNKELAACMVGYELEKTLSAHGSVSRGICKTDSEGNLLEIKERTSIAKEHGKIFYTENDQRYYLTGQEIASMNLIGFTPSVFEIIEEGFISFLQNNAQDPKAEYYVPDVLKMLIGRGVKIPVLQTSSEWLGITYKEDGKYMQEQLLNKHRKGEYPAELKF